MEQHKIPYLPASVELGDFDPSAIAIAVNPNSELRHLPQSALSQTFEDYIVTSPLEEPLKGVLVNGKPSATFNAHRATVDEFPAEVVLQYSHYQAVTKSIHRRKNLIFFNRLDAVLIA